MKNESSLRLLVRSLLRESDAAIDLFDPRFDNARAGMDPEMKKQLNDLRRAHKVVDFSRLSKADDDAFNVSNPPHPQYGEYMDYLRNLPENVKYRYLSKGRLFGYDAGTALGGKRQALRFIRAVIRDGAAAACQANPKAKALCDKQDPAALADPEWLDAALSGAKEIGLD